MRAARGAADETVRPADCDGPSAAIRTAIAIPASTSRLAEGHIGLQCHMGNVQFRNVMIRALR
jgi:hypothetical protein